ncbi:hypothetical protein MUP32_05185 [Candidatus Microgenomates bacterium]|nr:hypothetical protein [Candidatus Microgenomates bacterium]
MPDGMELPGGYEPIKPPVTGADRPGCPEPSAQLPRYRITDMVRFKKGEGLSDAVKMWLGIHTAEYRYSSGSMNRFPHVAEDWLDIRRSHTDNQFDGMQYRGYVFELPAEGPLKQGLKGAKIIMLFDGKESLGIICPDLSEKEVGLELLADLRLKSKIGDYKKPILTRDKPVEYYAKKLPSSFQNSWDRQMKKRVEQIWFELREELSQPALEKIIGPEEADKLRHAWRHFSVFFKSGFVDIDDTQDPEMGIFQLPLLGTPPRYEDPQNPPRLEWADIAPGTPGNKKIWG